MSASLDSQASASERGGRREHRVTGSVGDVARPTLPDVGCVQSSKPGDRIVVVHGAGHAAWLRDMIETTPDFRLVEPDEYLPEE